MSLSETALGNAGLSALRRWTKGESGKGDGLITELRCIVFDYLQVTRRERIATAALAATIEKTMHWDPTNAAGWAVAFADALIAELDKPRKP